MQAVRQGLNVLGHFQKTLAGVADVIVEFNCRFGELLPPLLKVDRQHRHSLIDIVVQFSRDPGALLFLGFNQSAPNAGQRFLGLLALGHVDARSDVAVKRPVRI